MSGVLFVISMFLLAIGILLAAIKGLAKGRDITSFWSGAIFGDSRLAIIIIEIAIILALVAVLIQGEYKRL